MELVFLRPGTSRVLGNKKNYYVKFYVKCSNTEVGGLTCLSGRKKVSVPRSSELGERAGVKLNRQVETGSCRLLLPLPFF